MDKLELSIIIVDYHSSKLTINLIKNLGEKLSDIRYEIIVVDNDPKSQADKKIKGCYKDMVNLNVIKANKNLGFGGGNNLGAKKAKGQYLLLLNPDTKIIDNSIQKMIDFLAHHPEVGALTPLLYQKDEITLQRHFYGQFQTLGRIILRNQAGKMPTNPEDFFYTDMVTGAAMMIKNDIFEKINGFDERFFMYIEDEDLCHQISNLGLKNAVLTTAKIIHFEGQSSTTFEKKKFYYRSQDYYWQKHYGAFPTTLMQIIRLPYILVQRIINKD